MNVQEMHIEIDMSSQKIRSNYFRKFRESEIDWLLNKHTDRFIKDRIKQDADSLGFDATQIDLDALRTIVVLDRELKTFVLEDDAVRAELPGNYSYLVDDFSYVIDKCDTKKYKQGSTTTSAKYYVYALPLNETAKSSAPFYQTINVKVNNVDVINVTGLTGLQVKAETFTVRDYIMSQLWKNAPAGVDFYWEEFGGISKPNTILVVSTILYSTPTSITIDGGAGVVAAAPTELSLDFLPAVSGGKLSSNRLVRGHMRSEMRSSSFGRTTTGSPISALTGNQIKVYHDKKFIVSKLKVSYVRKPAKISLLLNQNCDIAPEFHQEICDRVVVYIKELTMSPDWEIRLKDMMMNKD